MKIVKRRGYKHAFIYQVRKKHKRIMNKIKVTYWYKALRMIYFLKKRNYGLKYYIFLRKYNILIEDISSVDFIIKEFNNIKVWLESKEFKERYSNHPYPSLFNPEKLDYAKISASVAWDLNIPLPLYYKFCFFGSHATGNRGLESFLRRCGGLNYCVQSPSLKCESWAKESYFCYFKQIIENYCVFPPPQLFCVFINKRIYG